MEAVCLFRNVYDNSKLIPEPIQMKTNGCHRCLMYFRKSKEL